MFTESKSYTTVTNTNGQIDQVEENTHSILRLPATVDVGTLDAAYSDFCKNVRAKIQNLIIDLNVCTYVEVPALMFLTAIVTSRRNDGLFTQFRLPESIYVRDFMRRWDFPRAIKTASKVNFSDLVVEEDLKYFRGMGGDEGEHIIKYKGAIAEYDTKEGKKLVALELNRFFAFQAWTLDREIPKEYINQKDLIVEDELSRWDNPLVISVLESYFDIKGKYIQSHIVHEALANAVQHPEAKSILAASQYDNKGKTFTLTWWDDGKPIFTTIRRALEAGRNIRSFEPSNLPRDSYHVKFEESGKIYPLKRYDACFTPSLKNEDYEMLLSALLPGISCAIPQSSCFDYGQETDKLMNNHGMGLFNLINAAVDVLGGSVSFRTGILFMNVKAYGAKKADRRPMEYAIKVKHVMSEPFLGNMITVRIPIKTKKAEP
jgi:hypothetical protein